MEKLILNVQGMSCEHCVRAITQAVGVLPGVSSVSVDLGAGTVTAERDPALATTETITHAIEDQGYTIL